MQKKRWRELFWVYAPLFIWIGVIFFLSSSQGSMAQTSRIIRPLLEFFFPIASPETIGLYHGAIRKLAHFTEYFILGCLAVRAFAQNGIRLSPYVSAGLVVVLVAVMDELYQSFNPARTGSSIDVAIDLGGGFSAIAVNYLFTRRAEMRTGKKLISSRPE